MSQGEMYALQAWEACSGSQDKHTKNMHRAVDSTGLTHVHIHTHFRHVTKVLPATSISLGYTSSSTDKSVINDYNRETWDPETMCVLQRKGLHLATSHYSQEPAL